MRKILTVLVVTVLILVSCSFDSIDTHTYDTVKLNFEANTNNQAKTLSASFPCFDKTAYYWTYVAVKQDGGSTLGQRTSETDVKSSAGLGVLSSEFAVGKWKFTLRAYKTLEDRTNRADTKVIFEGSVEKKFTGVNATESITVSVAPLCTGTGFLKVGIFESTSKTDDNPKQYVSVKPYSSDTEYWTSPTESVTTATTIELPGGTYVVTVTLKDESGNVEALEPRSVTIYQNLTTEILGDVDDCIYTVTFDLKDGTETVVPQQIMYGEKVETPTDNPAKTGRHFKGWTTDSNAYTTSTQFDFDTSITADTTLYAVWAANSYKVSFNANTGTGTMSEQSFTYDEESKALLDNTFKKNGYGFVGWNTKADGTGTSYADKASVQNLTSENNGTVTLYAQWLAYLTFKIDNTTYQVLDGQTWEDFVASKDGFCVDTTNTNTILAGDVAHIIDDKGSDSPEYVTKTDEIVKDRVYTKGVLVTENDTSWGVTGKETLYLAYGTINIGYTFNTVQTVTCYGNVTLLLKDDCNLTVKGCSNNAGITVTGSGNSLTIDAETNGDNMGKLSVTGGNNGAGIGGGHATSGSNITINGGKVTTTGGNNGAGIGGGYKASGSYITITDGTVTALGGSSAAGIGGGYAKPGSNITINGGTVTATSGNTGAGIGGGYKASGSDITINGGKVTANGCWFAAGIGGGAGATDRHAALCDEAFGKDIIINGGTVIAAGYVGIGSGYKSSQSSGIYISNGLVVKANLYNSGEIINPTTEKTNNGTDWTSVITEIHEDYPSNGRAFVSVGI